MKRMAPLLLAVLVLASSCQRWTRRGPDETPLGKIEFRPARHLSAIHIEEGRYPALFSADSYALWLAPEVVSAKRAAAPPESAVSPEADANTQRVAESFLVVECHLESMFADMAIAYDAVSMRQLDVYMEMPDGRRIEPNQKLVGTPVTQEQRDALKLFRRTNLLIFPRRTLWMEGLAGEPGERYARLVFKGYDSEFYFEWPQGALTKEEERYWVPTPREAKALTVLTYQRLSRELLRLGHRFD